MSSPTLGTPDNFSSCTVYLFSCVLINGNWRHVPAIYSQYSRGFINVSQIQLYKFQFHISDLSDCKALSVLYFHRFHYSYVSA